MKLMIDIQPHKENGSALMCALGVITVLSLVGANLLLNCTTRYNTTSKQIKGWKEALIAAEAGADLAFAEVRLNGLDSTKGFAATGNWAAPAPSPLPATNSWELGYTKTGPSFGDNNSLHAKVTVDKFQMLSGSITIGYYRIRSVGTADLGGFARAGMDDRMNATTRGDSVLRKIDFSVDHFLSTFGYGDALATAAATGSNGKANTPVAKPQIARRVELIAVPVMPIEGAVKTNGGAFSFPMVDSYDSQYGAYPGPTPAAAPYNTASLQGNVVDGSSTFSAGHIYGDVTTNGGSASTGNVSGVVDNNVPVAPVSNMPYTPGTYESGSGSTITPPTRAISSAGVPPDYRQQTVFWYHYASISGLTINPVPALYTAGLPTGGIVETTVNIVCDGDVDGITVTKGVLARIYFKANVKGKANSYDNNNADGIQTLGVTTNPVVIPNYRTVVDSTTTSGSKTVTSATGGFTSADVGSPVGGTGIASGSTIASVTNSTTIVLSANANATSTNGTFTVESGYAASPNMSRADHLWFYGEGANQTITLDSAAPSTLYAGWYAPNADFSTNGNPDFVGAAVVKSFSGNGNNSFHYDKQLASASNPLDYRVASFIEDVR